MSRFKHWSKITRPAYRKTCLAIIGPQSNKKLTKYEIMSSYCWQQFGFIYPYLTPKIPFLSIFRIAYLHLPLFTYIWPYLDFITPIWSYLPLIALILPYVPYSMYSSIENIIHGDIALKRILGKQKVLTRMQFVYLFSHWQFLSRSIQSVVWLRIQLF